MSDIITNSNLALIIEQHHLTFRVEHLCDDDVARDYCTSAFGPCLTVDDGTGEWTFIIQNPDAKWDFAGDYYYFKDHHAAIQFKLFSGA